MIVKNLNEDSYIKITELEEEIKIFPVNGEGKIKIYNAKNQATGIKYESNKVVATKAFYRGDIIENAPVRILSDEDLYSPNVRDLVFMIDETKRLFGIPFGLASVARDESQTSLSANIDYEFDEELFRKAKEQYRQSSFFRKIQDISLRFRHLFQENF